MSDEEHNKVPDHACEAAKFLERKGWGDLVKSAQRKSQTLQFGHGDLKESKTHKMQRVVQKVKQVSKGTKLNDKSKILMQQHWLEATDYRHRYGTYLNKYFKVWQTSDTTQQFFYWLDEGEGKTLSLENCSREQLEAAQVEYLEADQRVKYEAEVRDGLFYYTDCGKPVHTFLENLTEDQEEDEDFSKFIFVISPDKKWYIGQKKRGKFHHSSFLAGGSAIGAGNLQIDQGRLINIKPHSGHYMPTAEEFQNMIELLKGYKVDISTVAIGEVKKIVTEADSLKKIKKLQKHMSQPPQYLHQNATDPDQSPQKDRQIQLKDATIKNLEAEIQQLKNKLNAAQPSVNANVNSKADSNSAVTVVEKSQTSSTLLGAVFGAAITFGLLKIFQKRN